MTDEVYIAVHDDGSVEAFDDVDTARNAVRDDENGWCELVQIQHAPTVDDFSTRRRSWISPPNLVYNGPNDAA